MKRYADDLASSLTVHYVEANQLAHSGDIVTIARKLGVRELTVLDVNDDWLSRRLQRKSDECQIILESIEDPNYLTSRAEIDAFAGKKSQLFFTNFYIAQRKRLEILLDDDGGPIGGKWSYDAENRKKLPRTVKPPSLIKLPRNEYVDEATAYVKQNFPHAIGCADNFDYPIDHKSAMKRLKDFAAHRFELFGDYEDAISATERTLFHSVLTPSLTSDSSLRRMCFVKSKNISTMYRSIPTKDLFGKSLAGVSICERFISCMDASRGRLTFGISIVHYRSPSMTAPQASYRLTKRLSEP